MRWAGLAAVEGQAQLLRGERGAPLRAAFSVLQPGSETSIGDQGADRASSPLFIVMPLCSSCIACVPPRTRLSPLVAAACAVVQTFPSGPISSSPGSRASWAQISMGGDSRMENSMDTDDAMGQDDDAYLESDEDGCCYVPPPASTEPEPFVKEHPLQWRPDPPAQGLMGELSRPHECRFCRLTPLARSQLAPPSARPRTRRRARPPTLPKRRPSSPPRARFRPTRASTTRTRPSRARTRRRRTRSRSPT